MMNHIRRIALALAGFGSAALALSAATPPALASMPPPDPGGTEDASPAVHTVVIGGMPGWQIVLIAAGAALLAAVLAVSLDRMWAMRRRASA
jgi:hypothetical protein